MVDNLVGKTGRQRGSLHPSQCIFVHRSTEEPLLPSRGENKHQISNKPNVQTDASRANERRYMKDVPDGSFAYECVRPFVAASVLTLGGGPVHDLVLGDGLALVVLVGTRPRCLSSDDGHLHVLDLDAHQQKVDLHSSFR